MNICLHWHAAAFIFLTKFLVSVTSQYVCVNNTDYASNSTYRTNLETLLFSLSQNVGTNGFHNASVGQGPDRANAIVLCRPDIQFEACRGCVHDAALALVQHCPRQRQAYMWRDSCMVRFSNESIFGTLTTFPSFMVSNEANASNIVQLETNLNILLDNLREQAASCGPVRKYAVGSRKGHGYQTIYAMAQCTPDILSADCNTCLVGAAQDLRRSCDGRTAAGIFRPSCNLRYGPFHFYNESMLQIPSPPTTGTMDDSNRIRRLPIIIVLPFVGCFIIAVCAAIFLAKRIKSK